MAVVQSIEAPGLDRLSRAELMEFLEASDPPIPADAVTFESGRRSEAYGEPATLVVILSLIALRAFVAWLALRPRNKRITQTISIQLSDSTVLTKKIDVKVPESGDVKPELVKELLSIEGLTPDLKSALKKALGP